MFKGLAAFILVPLLELAVLIRVGGQIGALPTVLLCLLTATIGVWLLRREGIATARRLQEKLNRDELPETELLEGVALIIGGALLLTPGFITDTIGFICLLPGLRRPLVRKIVESNRFRSAVAAGRFRRTSSGDHTIIEGEFVSEERGDASKLPETRDTRRDL